MNYVWELCKTFFEYSYEIINVDDITLTYTLELDCPDCTDIKNTFIHEHETYSDYWIFNNKQVLIRGFSFYHDKIGCYKLRKLYNICHPKYFKPICCLYSHCEKLSSEIICSYRLKDGAVCISDKHINYHLIPSYTCYDTYNNFVFKIGK